MLDRKLELRINELAYVPEHVIPLITALSKGEPFFSEGFLYFRGDYWVIFVGYPLGLPYSEEKILSSLDRIFDSFDFEYLWLIAPKIPNQLKEKASLQSKDRYYILELNSYIPPERLIKKVNNASSRVSLKISKSYTEEHLALTEEFLKGKVLDPFVLALFKTIPTYIRDAQLSYLIEARDLAENLCGFYVIDAHAKDFLVYLLGCRKTSLDIKCVSDILFLEMVNLAKKLEKKYIHLGLGVSEGIKRFKEKWGGKPFLPYEFIEVRRKKNLLEKIKRLERIL
ncbi:MAG: hypothetical protein NZ583_07520 [Desulfobacterota bacterium]|nr:hypothetical protein [Thermodesulfobacteriota bacterium]MDW8001052.1 hypothetical protein [Deltaproteobacteria bacterium]